MFLYENPLTTVRGSLKVRKFVKNSFPPLLFVGGDLGGFHYLLPFIISAIQ